MRSFCLDSCLALHQQPVLPQVVSRCPGLRLTTSFRNVCVLLSHEQSSAWTLSWNQSKTISFGVLVCVRRPGLRLTTCFIRLMCHEHNTARILSWSPSKIFCFGVSVCVSVSKVQAKYFILSSSDSQAKSRNSVVAVGVPGVFIWLLLGESCRGKSLKKRQFLVRRLL